MSDDGALRRLWSLDPAVTFLNHGSFGACPIAVRAQQDALRLRIARDPARFFRRELAGLLDEARAATAAFVGASAGDLSFVPNATTGVNTVLRSLTLAPGDELLTTDHAYNACRNALDHVAARAGARVVVASIPLPVAGPDAVLEAVLARVSSRTRVALIDQITSMTALVFPVDRLVRELDARGVDTLVDAAHAPGMVPLDLDATGAAYTTGNFHKWVCAPKGAAFLHVRRDRQAAIRPLVTTGAEAADASFSSRIEAGLRDGGDPTAALLVPAALRSLEGLAGAGGLAAIMGRNHAATLAGRRMLLDALGSEPPCPDEMLGAMASVPIPGEPLAFEPNRLVDPLQRELSDRFGIQIPIIPWPGMRALVRISTPIYATRADIETLVRALAACDLRGG